MAIKLVGVAGEKLLEAEKSEQTQDFVTGRPPGLLHPRPRRLRPLLGGPAQGQAIAVVAPRVRAPGARLAAPALEGAPGGDGQEARQPAPDPVLEPDPLPPGPTGGPVLIRPDLTLVPPPPPSRSEGQAPRGPVLPPRVPGGPLRLPGPGPDRPGRDARRGPERRLGRGEIPVSQGRHDPDPAAGLRHPGADGMLREPLLHPLARPPRASTPRRDQPGSQGDL